MIRYNWKESGDNCFYYYNVDDGRIVGQVYNLAHTKIWGAKSMEEYSLGLYISTDSAMKALELYFDIENRTLIENV